MSGRRCKALWTASWLLIVSAGTASAGPLSWLVHPVKATNFTENFWSARPVRIHNTDGLGYGVGVRPHCEFTRSWHPIGRGRGLRTFLVRWARIQFTSRRALL